MFPFKNMEGSSVQIQAEYADRDPNNNRIQTASLKINLQTLKVKNGSPGEIALVIKIFSHLSDNQIRRQ